MYPLCVLGTHLHGSLLIRSDTCYSDSESLTAYLAHGICCFGCFVHSCRTCQGKGPAFRKLALSLARWVGLGLLVSELLQYDYPWIHSFGLVLVNFIHALHVPIMRSTFQDPVIFCWRIILTLKLKWDDILIETNPRCQINWF